MICTQCGHPNREEARFCIQCGNALAAQPVPGITSMSHSRRRPLLGLLALVVVVGLGAAVVLWLMSSRPPTPVAQATPGSTAELDAAGESPVASPTASPVGQPTESMATLVPTTTTPAPEIQFRQTGQPVLAGTPAPSALPITSDNADTIQQLARWGQGTVNSITYSPNGRLLAVASSVGVVFLDTDTFTEVGFLPTLSNVDRFLFSPNEDLFALMLRDTVQLWRNGESTPFNVIEPGYMLDLAFSGDGKSLVTAVFPDPEAYERGESQELRVEVWQHRGDVMTRDREVSLTVVPESYLTARFSPDGGTLAVVALTEEDGLSSSLYLWDVSSEELIYQVENVSGQLSPAVFHPTEKFVLSMLAVEGEAGEPDEYTNWQVSLGNGELTATGVILEESLYDPATSVIYTPDGQTLIGTEGYELILMDGSDGRVLKVVEGHQWWIESVAVAPDSETFATSSTDGSIRIWRVSDGAPLATLDNYTSGGNAHGFAWDSDEEVIAINFQDKVHTRRLSDGVLLDSVMRQYGITGDVIYIDDEAIEAYNVNHNTEGNRWRYQLHRVTDNSVLIELEGLQGFSYVPASLSADNNILAASSWVHSDPAVYENEGHETLYEICVWNLTKGSLLTKLQNRFSDNFTLSLDGTQLAVFMDDGSPWIWNVTPNSTATLLAGATEEELTWGGPFAFSPDGQTIAFGSRKQGIVRLWNTTSGNPIAILYEGMESIGTMTFSPDGSLLVVGDANDGQGRLQVWSVLDGILLTTLEGGGAKAVQLAFIDEGRYLLAGMQDGTVRLWGVATELPN